MIDLKNKKMTLAEQLEKTVNEFHTKQDVEVAIIEVRKALAVTVNPCEKAVLAGMISTFRKVLNEQKEIENHISKVKRDNGDIVVFTDQLADIMIVLSDLCVYYHDIYVAAARSVKLTESYSCRSEFKKFRKAVTDFRNFLYPAFSKEDRQNNNNLQIRFQNYIRRNIFSKDMRTLYDKFDEIAGNY